ncbi:MAG: PHP domain-containing protein [Candidatus Omnitrophica bacterium]|nr:PHP domain-containing protein [Candidatus Omnitrophota bacterium]
MPSTKPMPAESQMALADLHTHTYFSDGTESPARVVEMAKAAGLAAIAITDHDNIDAFPVALPIAQQLGIELLVGIEMSASYDGLEVHLLSYGFDRENVVLQKHLSEQKARRVERVHTMVKRLQAVGCQIEAEEVFAIAGAGTVGRPHVARVLLKHGYISRLSEAFSRYIGPDNPGFVPGSPLAPKEVIRVIRAANGIPVLAHPIFLKRDQLIATFVEQGLGGLEVFHSNHPPDAVARYNKLANRLGLLKTGGSDFHGDTKEGLPIGTSAIPYHFVEALKRRSA